MDITKARKITESLANGIDPSTGEIFPQDSPYHHPDIVRALFCLLKNDKGSNPSAKSKRTAEDKQQDNIDKGLPRNSGFPWTDELKTFVADEYKQGTSPQKIAEKLERTKGSIVSELRKQGIITPEEAANLMGYSAPIHSRRPVEAI
jgi:hypothetical protein